LHILKPKLLRKFEQIKRDWCYGTPSRTIPQKLKISPIAAIPHKSKDFRSILDLSFRLRLKNGGVQTSVNKSTKETAPAGAIDQIGECLSRIIHAFAEADDDTKIFMAKWDIKDGFWRMDCAAGKEWNFTYVLPQEEGEPLTLAVPTSLQMGWVESPPYFCAATETSRDISTDYIETKVISLHATNLNATLLAHRLIPIFRNQDKTHKFSGTWSRFMWMIL
jgi:hypothetical protein